MHGWEPLPACLSGLVARAAPPCLSLGVVVGRQAGHEPKEALNKSDFVVAICLAHKKHLLTYHLYAASIFFARALSRLELELIQSFPNVLSRISGKRPHFGACRNSTDYFLRLTPSIIVGA